MPSNGPGYFNCCGVRLAFFSLPVAKNGIRIAFNDLTLYTEVPGGPAPGILDGFMASLLGLYDLLVETGDAEMKRLFDAGIAGLIKALPYWNYRDKWSWYSVAHTFLRLLTIARIICFFRR